MSTLDFAVRDSRTMLRRNLRHMWRYPTLTLMVAGIPVPIKTASPAATPSSHGRPFEAP